MVKTVSTSVNNLNKRNKKKKLEWKMPNICLKGTVQEQSWATEAMK
jgi:hypothetical protein